MWNGIKGHSTFVYNNSYNLKLKQSSPFQPKCEI